MNEEQINKLINLYEEGESYLQIAEEVKISQSDIGAFFRVMEKMGILTEKQIEHRKKAVDDRNSTPFGGTDYRNIAIQMLSERKNFPIGQLELTTPAYNSLRRKGIENTSQIKSLDDLLEIRGFGKSRINEFIYKWQSLCDKESDTD